MLRALPLIGARRPAWAVAGRWHQARGDLVLDHQSQGGPVSRGGTVPVARAIHLWLVRMRTAAYAWLEEVRFRTGVLLLAGSAAIAGCATAAVIVAVHGGSPAAVHRSLAGQARPAAPPEVRPSRPAARPPQPRQAAPAARRTGSADWTGNTTNTASYIASSGPRPNHRWRRGQRATGHWDHLTGRDWWHHGHSPWHDHSPWHNGHSRWHYGGAPHPLGRHRPGHGHW
jgi:hypothetical protein